MVASVAVADIALGVVYPPSCTEDILPEVMLLGRLVMVGPCSSLDVLVEMFESPERRLAQSIHSFHDRDRWNRDYVLVEVAEILTWAERGKPLNEHRRTPLWSNSDQERSAPDLIFPAVRRARCTNDRGDTLRIAWK